MKCYKAIDLQNKKVKNAIWIKFCVQGQLLLEHTLVLFCACGSCSVPATARYGILC